MKNPQRWAAFDKAFEVRQRLHKEAMAGQELEALIQSLQDFSQSTIIHTARTSQKRQLLKAFDKLLALLEELQDERGE